MPKYTPNLNIQLADPATDGNQTFNIETMINDPVEKLDEALGLVPVSGDVRAATTGNIVLSGAQTIDGIALATGNRVLAKNQTAGKENGIYTVSTGAWTRTVDANTTAKLAAGISVYVEEGATNGKTQWQMVNTGAVTLDTTAIIFEKTGGPGAATDTVIGSRTVSDATAPTGDSGTVTILFGWLANMVKAITGGATWRTLPGMSIAAIKTVLDAATNAATGGALIKRDANGRAQVAVPSAAADIARKDTVDGAVTAHKAEADPHTGYVKKSGDTMTSTLIAPGVAAVNDGNAIVTIEDTGAPTNSFRIKQLFSTRNAVDAWLFRSVRPSDVKISDVLLKGIDGVPTTIPLCTYSDMTYYVRTDGNDNNTGTANTAAEAFKTIAKAVSMIPQVVNHSVLINVGAGTYAEDIVIHGFVGIGYILIKGTSATVSSVGIYDCPIKTVIQTLILSKTSGPAIVYNNATGSVSGCTITGSATDQRGIYVDEGARVFVVSTTISNRYYGILSGTNSVITSINNIGSGNAHGLYAYSGTIYINGSQPAGINGNGVNMGGIVVPQVGVLNPWGDNTQSSRSVCQAAKITSPQTITGATIAKITYETEQVDQLGEYNPTLSRFTASATGFYLISAKAYIVSNIAGNGYEMYAFVNGTERRGLGITRASTTGTSTLQGDAIIYLSAGDYLEIWVGCDNNLTINYHGSRTTLDIARIA